MYYVYDTSTHSQLFNSVRLSCLRVPHLPNTIFSNPFQPLLGYFSIEIKLFLIFQGLKNKVIRRCPGWASPHQIDCIDRVVSSFRSRNCRNRVFRLVVFFLNNNHFTLLSISMMLSLCF